MFEGQSGEDGLFQVPKTCRFDMEAMPEGNCTKSPSSSFQLTLAFLFKNKIYIYIYTHEYEYILCIYTY